MSYTYDFEDIYDYFWTQCTDEEVKQNSTIKCDQYIRAKFANFITYVDEDATIDYTAKTFVTTNILTEKLKNLLGMWMYEKLYENELSKYLKLVNIVSDSHRVTGIQDRVSNIRKRLDDIRTDVNNILATLL